MHRVSLAGLVPNPARFFAALRLVLSAVEGMTWTVSRVASTATQVFASPESGVWAGEIVDGCSKTWWAPQHYGPNFCSFPA